MKGLTVSVQDRPGTLADVGEALGRSGVNIEGLCLVTSEGGGLIHPLVADAAAAVLQSRRRALRSRAKPIRSYRRRP